MSQFFLGATAGSLPPSVAEEFDTQDGNAVPLAHVLIINGFDSTENNPNGIITKGGVVGTGVSNEVDVVITNRAYGTVTTANAVETTVITFALGASAGLYTVSGFIGGFITASNAGGSYFFDTSVRTDGATATEIGTEYSTTLEDVAMVNSDIFARVSGNNLLINVQGIAATTINWVAKFEYTLVN